METLNLILEKHALWLNGDPNGKRANLSGVNLSGVNLSGVNLSGANLYRTNISDAYLYDAILIDAYLSNANLSGVDLSNTNLSGANLSHANISDANLSDANLSRAILIDAYLSNANLSGVDLRGADLSGADLSGAILSGANLSGATFDRDNVPIVENIDSQICDIVCSNPERLDMESYHGQNECATTHCRAGWAIILAGEKGRKLESQLGSCVAGALIYAASRPNMPVPDFFCSNEDALDDIRKCASI